MTSETRLLLRKQAEDALRMGDRYLYIFPATLNSLLDEADARAAAAAALPDLEKVREWMDHFPGPLAAAARERLERAIAMLGGKTQ